VLISQKSSNQCQIVSIKKLPWLRFYKQALGESLLDLSCETSWRKSLLLWQGCGCAPAPTHGTPQPRVRLGRCSLLPWNPQMSTERLLTDISWVSKTCLEFLKEFLLSQACGGCCRNSFLWYYHSNFFHRSIIFTIAFLTDNTHLRAKLLRAATQAFLFERVFSERWDMQSHILFFIFFLWKHLSHTCKGNGTQEGANAMSGTVSSLSQLAGQMFMRSDKQQSQLMGWSAHGSQHAASLRHVALRMGSGNAGRGKQWGCVCAVAWYCTLEESVCWEQGWRKMMFTGSDVALEFQFLYLISLRTTAFFLFFFLFFFFQSLFLLCII